MRPRAQRRHSTVWTTGERRSPAQAALLNGTAAHALDWDDVSPGRLAACEHRAAPALLAEAEESNAGGPALVRAHDVGSAAFRAVAQALPRAAHYRRGWHTTSTVGRIAAVAALANLRGLDEQATRQRPGHRRLARRRQPGNFGTMTKPLHAGVAARDAVMAVGLAAEGFTANPPAGVRRRLLRALRRPRGRASRGLADDLEHWRGAWPEDWAVKRYPACYCTHRAIDATLSLQGGARRASARSHRGRRRAGRAAAADERAPATPTEAKFNMAYGVASALVSRASCGLRSTRMQRS